MKAAEITLIEKDGFSGYYYVAPSSTDKGIIVLIGDEGNDFMDKACAKWLTMTVGCNALCLGIRQKKSDDTGIHQWPLEYVEKAVQWLQKKGISKVGILGMSMPGCLALAAASHIPDISLVIAMTPCDFVPWGFFQGKIQNAPKGEWPSGTSAFSWRGEDLPFQPAYLEKDAYWNMFCEDKKKFHEMHTITIFDHSENTSPIPDECFIPVENIRGKIIFTGTGDDTMWNTSRYIGRMNRRLQEKGSDVQTKTFLYPYGTHLLVPETMLKNAIPVFGDLISKMFQSGKEHPAECKQARIDLEAKLTKEIKEW